MNEMLLRNVKIKPSKVCDGVGLFPIDKILKGDVVFNYINADYPSTFNISKMSHNKKQYLHTLWGVTNMIPTTPIFHPVNFLNHSTAPTVIYEDNTGNYIALRDLQPTDEILINYIGYNDPLHRTIKSQKTMRVKKRLKRQTIKYMMNHNSL